LLGIQSRLKFSSSHITENMEVVVSNPPHPMRPTGSISSFRSRPRALSDSEVMQLRRAVVSCTVSEDAGPEQTLMLHRDQAISLLLITTGITLQETCALDTRDVRKYDDGRFFIVAQRHNRIIPLESDVVKAVNRWLALRQLVYRGREFRPLFITRRQERITPVAVRNVLERLKVESGVSFDSFALRHAFIRRMMKQGYSNDEVSAMLGRPSRGIIEMYAAQ
jgi:site-specific recombinase XerD